MPDHEGASKPKSPDSKRLAFSAERGRYIYNGDRVFLGSIDDSVSRNPWEGYRASLKYLNKRLVDSVLFGSPVSMRIGNLVYQDEYLGALLNPPSSQLFELAKVGFVQVQMKCDSINEAIASRVVSKTKSALDFEKKHLWHQGSESYQALDFIDQALESGVGKLTYSGEFNRYFRAIMKESAEGGTDAFRLVYEEWSKRPAEGKEPRTRDWFEKDAHRIFEGGMERIVEAMWVANAANHYAYSLQFIDNTGGSEGLPMVETTQFDRHAEVCSRRQSLPTELAEELLAKADLRDPINLALSVINVPNAAYDPANAKLLSILAHRTLPTTDKPFDEVLWKRFKNAKTGLITSINTYLEDPAPSNSDLVGAHAAYYNAVLQKAFGVPRETKWGAFVRFVKHTENQKAFAENVATNLGTFGAGLAHPMLGLTLGITLMAAPIRNIMKAADLKRFKAQADHPVDVLLESNDPETAKRLMSETAYSRYGTYVGVRTLDRDKALEFRENLDND